MKRPEATKIVNDLTALQRKESTADFLRIQEMKFVLRPSVPRKLCTLWSDILTDIALAMTDATTESEARKALRRYLMLKAVLIKPERGGGGRLNRNLNLTERLMTSFYKGREDEVWQTAEGIEKSRQKKREAQRKRNRKRNHKGDRVMKTTRKDDVKRRSDRAKILTSDGEL